MIRILVVEDEPDMATGLKDNLEFEGYSVEIAPDGEIGLKLARANPYDLILLDIMLPKISGFDLCKALRNDDIRTPVIMLTAKGQEIDKVLGLELGADDYITKPFGLRELSARIKAVLRRSNQASPEDGSIVVMGNLKIDFDHYLAEGPEGSVELTHKELEILKHFHTHESETVSRDDLLNKVWGYEVFPVSRTVDNFILNLRKKLESDPSHPKHILTVHGIGYKYIR